MRAIGLIGWAVAACLTGMAMPAAAQRGVVKAEIRRQSPAVTEREVRDQLWGAFQLDDQRRDNAPQMSLRELELKGRSYATDEPGVCRADMMRIHFAPQFGDERHGDANSPTRAYQVETWPVYKVVREIEAGSPDREAWTASPWYRECQGLDVTQGFFGASDIFAAREGFSVLKLLDRALAAGAIKPDCGTSDYNQQRCGQELVRLIRDLPNYVDRCGDDRDACLVFHLRGGGSKEYVDVRIELAQSWPRDIGDLKSVRVRFPSILDDDFGED